MIGGGKLGWANATTSWASTARQWSNLTGIAVSLCGGASACSFAAAGIIYIFHNSVRAGTLTAIVIVFAPRARLIHASFSAARKDDMILVMLELAKCHIRQDQPNAALDVYLHRQPPQTYTYC